MTEVPEQKSSEGKELLFETKIINVLIPTLDSEHERINRIKETDTPRETLRQFLENKQPRYGKTFHGIMSNGTPVFLRANANPL